MQHSTLAPRRHTVQAEAVDPRVDECLRALVAIGAVLVLLLPAARGTHAAIGWLPLWLLAMPLAAWWALHRFRLPGRQASPAAHEVPAARAVRRAPVQARRRKRMATGTQPARAA